MQLFNNFGKAERSGLAFVSGALAVGLLAGCGGSGSTTVSGNRDDLRHKLAVHAVTVPSTRVVGVYSKHCTTTHGSKTVGSGKKRHSMRTTSTKCKNVKTGSKTESYRKTVKPGKPALYCVELDNVNGSKKNDDVWYTVTSTTYYEATRKDEGDKVKRMSYLHTGCWR